MANSTSNIDTISASQAQKEVTANAYLDAASPSVLGGRRASTTNGLTWGYYGGTILSNGAATQIPNGTLTLTASASNYIQMSPSGTISSNTSGFPIGYIPLYLVVTGASSVTSYTDYRTVTTPPYISHSVTANMATDADRTLTTTEARCTVLTITSGVSLTALRNIIVPDGPSEFVLENKTTGGWSVFVKTASGTGVRVSNGAKMLLQANGTDVVPAIPGQIGQVQAFPYAASITPDINNGTIVYVSTLTGNITVNEPTNPILGASIDIRFAQDGTGGRTITWNAVFKKAADGAGTAGQVGVTRFFFDGSNWIQVGGPLTWF